VLALLGLAAAAAAAAWYVHLRPAPPTVLNVPRVVGLGEGPAVRALTNEGFRVRAVEEELSSSGRAVVTTQRPPARTRLVRGATVTIHVVRRPDRTLAGR
jgi:beta-lactam-binding protein with PASTA domain